MSTEEYLAHLNGQIDALMHLCSVLLATHPMAPQLTRTFLQSCETAPQKAKRDSVGQAYAAGYASAAASVLEAQKTVQQAGQIRDLKPEGGH